MNALLAGASGLVGGEIARQWAGPGTLHLLLRQPLAEPGLHPVVLTPDFAALPALPPAEMAFCALGTTLRQAGSKRAFRAVDLHAVLAFAHAARAAGVTRFAVVSSLGADPRSSNFYARTKGDMEAALAMLGFASLVVARPSLLTGNRDALGQPLRRGERFAQRLSHLMGPLLPDSVRPIAAATVARALLCHLPEAAPGLTVLSSAALRKLAR
jgi:uncharacterized protein YbjT (DUF2867 family)